jgi:hypothetical protein
MEIELKIGKLYDCSVDCDNGIEDNHSIIPLAKKSNDKDKSQFVMIDAKRLYKQNPSFVKEIIKMSFEEIMNDGIQGPYPNECDSMTTLYSLHNDGTLFDNHENMLFGFVETDVI